MARMSHPVLRALIRWERKGLMEPGLAETLRTEVNAEAEGEGRRWSQYLLAATGGAVLIVAGGTFLNWVWPEMGPAGQAITLAVLGLLVLGLGMRLPEAVRWAPVALLLQVAGTVLVIMALVHSEEAWADGTLGGVCAGVAGLVLSGALVWKAMRESSLLPALQSALAFIFIFLFLDRALGLSPEPSLWVLDGIMVVGLAFLAFRLRDPAASAGTLNIFLALLLSAGVLVASSAEIIWELEEFTFIPMDVWLLIVAGLCVWGLQDDTPPQIQRGWYEILLALCVLTGMIFAFGTTLEVLDTGETPAALAVAAVGGLGLWFALPRGSRYVLVASCITLLIAAWYWGVETSGALGAVLALLAMSVILFWGAFRMGGGAGEETNQEV